jgi:hypothetical protein
MLKTNKSIEGYAKYAAGPRRDLFARSIDSVVGAVTIRLFLR